MSTKVIICGAGVGGLSAGVALRQAGFDVTLYERHPELRTAGVGLNVWPNGVRVLAGLGLGEAFYGIANRLDRYLTYSSSGELQAVEDVSGFVETYGAPLTGVYRRDLNAMIADALGFEHIRFGRELTGIEEQNGRVICKFNAHETVVGDVLIGADGVYSYTREHLFGTNAFEQDLQVRWRGLFQVEEAGVSDREEADVIGPEAHFGWIPLGKGGAYWYASGEQLHNEQDALELFNSWTETPVPGIVRATPDDTIIRNELYDLREPLTSWVSSRIALLGDAAHPMLPGVAQGANQALEDSAALARCLAECDGLEDGLRTYERTRMPTANAVVRISRSLFDYDDMQKLTDEIHINAVVARYARIVEGGQRV